MKAGFYRVCIYFERRELVFPLRVLRIGFVRKFQFSYYQFTKFCLSIDVRKVISNSEKIILFL